MLPVGATAAFPAALVAAAAGLALVARVAAGGDLSADSRVQDPAAPPGRTPCSRDSPDPIFAGLCAWLEDFCNATDIHRAFVADFEHGGRPVRGLGVSEYVRAGDYVFCVPEHCWLPTDKLPATDDAEQVDDDNATACPAYERFALWMAGEQKKGPDSFYHPYFLSLPSEEVYKRFHPAYLEGWELDESLDYWKVWLETLSKCHGGRESPTWEETKLAYVQLLTRQYEAAGMTPLLDMPNTAPDGELNVAQYLNRRGDFCLKATRDLPAGTELLVDYGGASHSAMLMFLLYGFAFDKEHHNETVPSDEEYATAEYMLSPRDGCAGLRPSEFHPPLDAGPALQNLASFALRFCADEDTTAKPQTSEL